MASDGKLIEEGNQETKIKKRGNFIISCEKIKIEIHSFEAKKASHKNT